MMEPLLSGMAQTKADRCEAVMRAGNTNCGGCGMSIGLQMLSRAAGDRPLQLVIPACCAIVTGGTFPYSGYGAPVLAATFASAAAFATGLAHAARLNREDRTRVVCWAGDGGTFDIGLATVSAAAERNEDLLYVCYDNEIYGNTGGQRSSATPLGAATSTTPLGKDVVKKDILGIIAAHRIPYAATVSLAHPEDMFRKLQHALEVRGFRFIHMLAPCPTGWKSEPAEGVELVRLAVRAGLYPVVELIDGDKLRLNVDPEVSLEALEKYVAAQGRFRKANVDVKALHLAVARQLDELRERAKAHVQRFPAGR